MARDIDKRLQQLRVRRHGTDRLQALNEEQRAQVLSKSLVDESWQKRAKTQPYTRYALGAMQEVGPDYTKVSIETAERVGNQLRKELTAAGFSVDFRLQGSVPLNVHIRGVSDVDLLNLDTSFFTYATNGTLGRAGHYTNPSPRTSIDVLTSLRAEAEKILKAKFPAAKIDMSGGKAITVSGGSLARPVDVVPSHWHDTAEYQLSSDECDRGVTILNKKVPETVDGLPFLHIKRVNDRNAQALDGLKKSIRLCKNVKSDAEAEGTDISLPSFDIAAVMYHAHLEALRMGQIFELAILAEAQRFLDRLYHDHDYAKTLWVPDGSRRIFNAAEKLSGLNKLSVEMDDLALEVAKEMAPQIIQLDPSLPRSREVLSSRIAPLS